MDAMMEFLGFGFDGRKIVDAAEGMVVLGHRVCADDQRQAAVFRMEEDKAIQWGSEFARIILEDRCDPALAGKFAGRLSWACAAQADCAGRAYTRPWYVAVHAALNGGRLRLWHRFSCRWWSEFLALRPVTIKHPWDIQRVHVGMWTDASGASWFVFCRFKAAI